ncbi:MFS transporter [Nocardia abscessus]|uniref:MFS transporter n=1 Tax=Nocardia abscessus TaxID=120957 RepID=UPI0002D3F591|nr:MFS transporter [Nocardia abscessus]MCC3327918.1 MFS transporter [Nocardia abscessus]
MLFKSIGELIPLYALYALLFADHGMSTGQISLLFAIWSTTAFLLEVPSGAWADTVSRRGLLVLSGVLLTAGFALWTAAPSFAGFAAGFVLWGTSGALASGTFEALLYDDLAARGESGAYPRILGYTRAGAEAAVVVAIVAATPLYLYGGYALVGWSSVAIAAVHTLVALSLPTAPKAVSAADVDDLEEESPSDAQPVADASDIPSANIGPDSGMRAACDGDADARAEGSRIAVASEVDGVGPEGVAAQPRPFARYLGMLKAGVGEAVRVRAVRYGVLLEALLFGITAFDEYFALLAEESGVSTAVVPLLVGLTVLGSLTGSLLAGRTEGMSGRTMSIAVGAAGLLFLGGAVIAGLATGRPDAVYPLTGLGFAAIGVSYGIVYNAGIVAGARLQDAIEGPARATVTSVSGLLGEVIALAVFGFAALVTLWSSMSTLLALLGASILAIATLAPRWLPQRADRP